MMKTARLIALIVGIVAIVVFLLPFTIQIESEGSVWFAFLAVLLAWYIIGPLLLICATLAAAISSALYVRDNLHNNKRRIALILRWLVVCVIEAVLVYILLTRPGISVSQPGLLIAPLSAVIVTVASTLALAIYLRTTSSRSTAVKH
ncbi:hypothetical protein [Lysinibacter cavernae]|uniref:Putative membrane protein n=1 Tax=Lysinibacter cavernae TaxID=1640652 RepID=A0A7X5R2X4_9MICO|nr:hypothetical protein [Lysinibacter cavernae]NIH54674.1 putative membrane protein [Lysinibacter cavernae]